MMELAYLRSLVLLLAFWVNPEGPESLWTTRYLISIYSILDGIRLL
jgi:hypothetical protein